MMLNGTALSGQSSIPEKTIDSVLQKCLECVEEKNQLKKVEVTLRNIIAVQEGQIYFQSQHMENDSKIKKEQAELIKGLNKIVEEKNREIKKEKRKSWFKGLLTGTPIMLILFIL